MLLSKRLRAAAAQRQTKSCLVNEKFVSRGLVNVHRGRVRVLQRSEGISFGLSETARSFQLESQIERVFTVETAHAATGHLKGLHSKNLFLQNKKKELALVVCEADESVDLKKLGVLLGATGGVRFASKETLREALGVLPGSVNPFSMIFAKNVRLVVSSKLLLDDERLLWFHPGSNDATVGISAADWRLFLKQFPHEAMSLN